MKRGILVNLSVAAILFFLILFPIIIFSAANGIARANDCVFRYDGWGEGICRDLYTLTFLTGIFGTITTPVFAFISALYLIGVVLFFGIRLLLAKKSGGQISAFGSGMLLSTFGLFALAAAAWAGYAAFQWYRVSFISSCQGLPASNPIGSPRNGVLAVGGKLPYPQGLPEQYAIRIISLGGENPRILNELSASKDPAWSSDGERLAFTVRLKDSSNWGLFWSGREERSSQVILTGALEMQSPDWSPDGSTIIFQRWREQSSNPDTEIFSVKLDGSNLQQLTHSEGFDGEARFSPDGDRIVFVSKRNGNGDIYVMNSDGANLRRLTYHPSEDIHPDWSPDGEWIVFASNRNRGRNTDYDLYTMAADGTNQCRLTSRENAEWKPVWSPDGNWIAFIALSEQRIYRIQPNGNEIQSILFDQAFDPLNIAWGAAP